MKPGRKTAPATNMFLKWATILLLGLVVLNLGGCFRSTNVYSTDKTVVYNGSIYNVSNVKSFKAVVTAAVSPTDTRNVLGIDKKGFNAILDEKNPVLVRQVIMLDDQELVYQSANVKSWSEFNKMNKKFKSAGDSLTKFLANKKSTQLKLK
jgi:hypothetical protein